MKMRFANFISVLVLAATSTSVFASGAIANPKDSSSFQPIRLESIPDAFDRAINTDSGDFYRNRSIKRQVDLILGPGFFGRTAFPESEIERDAARLNKLYRELMYQQVSSDPILRTPDLPNPYNTSILQLPSSALRGNRVLGSEFFYETLPPR